MTDTTTPARALRAISDELRAAADAVVTTADADAAAGTGLDAVAALLDDADRVFVHGAGRSGLALRMTAMRLMHLGRTVHVVGDVTTPAIRSGDVLLTASGSGTTTGIVRAATTAREGGARVAVITTVAASPLADLADAVVLVPAPEKQAHGNGASIQYAGGLFEQVVVLVGDALFHAAWQRSGIPAADLWPRHANLE
ncbi:SIS domain-containing protein [Curtobacterium sp. MCBD17_035]|uniref:6-phospho-3-hexuloisomerase n=1 Tax=Curtobacterium sp. MCBD17_035 TaxID=2175673 RepID=UPI000DA8711B|nr:6-phospho-3-hexuloisomerase [Curtobacterium sp. MCBD17_035]WIB68755.1 SIS domain-containing protein [Curtobacterium sp. MCBD17_035]